MFVSSCFFEAGAVGFCSRFLRSSFGCRAPALDLKCFARFCSRADTEHLSRLVSLILVTNSLDLLRKATNAFLELQNDVLAFPSCFPSFL